MEAELLRMTEGIVAAKTAFTDIRASFAGKAKRLELNDERDVAELDEEVRREKWEELYGKMID